LKNLNALEIISNIKPTKILIFGYLSYILLGWLLLCLPFSQSVNVSALDNLFSAASAASTTGLVTVNVGESYTFFGELVILLLIQLGGIGYMTFGSFVVLSIQNRMSGMREDICKKTFSLPEDFSIKRFIKLVIVFTFICELVGAVILYTIFVYNNEPNPIWSAIFHSISAFCTAGFSLNANSFVGYADNPYLVMTIAASSYLGAIGFIVMVDIWHTLTKKQDNLHFTSKVIVEITLWFSFLGTLFLFIAEPHIANLAPWERLLAAFFQIMTATTTVGFNTVDFGVLSSAVILVVLFLMVFGASPSGTGGGLKSTTFAALWALMRSTLKERSQVRYNKRRLSLNRMQIATASFAYFCSIAFLATLLLLTLEQTAAFEVVLFEVISALGTVGLSMGITGDLSNLGKTIVIILMFMGRVGLLTAFGLVGAASLLLGKAKSKHKVKK